MMKRRDFLLIGGAGTLGISAAVAGSLDESLGQAVQDEDDALKLTPPKTGPIPVAFLISPHATVIDFAGPWEVFQDVAVNGRFGAFELFTVAESLDPVTATAGLKIVPNYSFDNAPQPKVIVIPAQSGRPPALFDWLRGASEEADVVMSVCTGAFLLAKSGLIDGKTATTHHHFYDAFAREFPHVSLKRDVRFVEEQKFSSAGGLTSGIDLALRIVERYFGRDVAQQTAVYMEYQSTGWKLSASAPDEIES
jgi:transcriptional regulator GlxA family with amidase domain